MNTKILRLLLFPLAVLAVLAVLGLVLVPKNNDLESGIYYPNAMGPLGEPADSLDYLIIGDSEVCAAFIPMQVWRDTGIAGYCCSTTDQKLYETEQIAKAVLKNQHPKIVFLETNVFFHEMNRLDIIEAKLKEYIPAYKYHDRWKNLTLRDLNPRVNYTYRETEKGYYASTGIEAADDSWYLLPSEDTAVLPKANLRLINRILEEVAAVGATPVFITSPNTMNWDTGRYNGMCALSQSLGVAYVDMNRQDLGIDWETDSRDAGDHLNNSGAVKATRWITEYLKASGHFTDKRTAPAYAPWNQDLENAFVG